MLERSQSGTVAVLNGLKLFGSRTASNRQPLTISLELPVDFGHRATRLGQSEVSQAAEQVDRQIDVGGVAGHHDEEDQYGVCGGGVRFS